MSELPLHQAVHRSGLSTYEHRIQPHEDRMHALDQILALPFIKFDKPDPGPASPIHLYAQAYLLGLYEMMAELPARHVVDTCLLPNRNDTGDSHATYYADLAGILGLHASDEAVRAVAIMALVMVEAPVPSMIFPRTPGSPRRWRKPRKVLKRYQWSRLFWKLRWKAAALARSREKQRAVNSDFTFKLHSLLHRLWKAESVDDDIVEDEGTKMTLMKWLAGLDKATAERVSVEVDRLCLMCFETVFPARDLWMLLWTILAKHNGHQVGDRKA
ncbi:hypothetical protein LTR56_005574 [Elasticomyces elasticus]|nr:hypothetical protein LTR22_017161 [Elasticomyces elasticus]KAK3651766.1 hypothetical protein LTR56_005574 [Elasticomyces elasticus]KAK4913329.1 hypothetical protein LTR49_018310 [Elasticomyces elasticus]KAK5769135.1 hypothetical protein LTS12_000486 [Elasticomyces elasticus]